MWFLLLAIFGLTFLISLIITYFIKSWTEQLGIMDQPQAPRKLHSRPVPLLGGVAIFTTFFLVLYLLRGFLISVNLGINQWVGFFIGSILLMLGGYWDDKYHISPGRQFVWPVLAALAVIGGGVTIEKLSHPGGGFIYLSVFTSGAIIFLWLLGMMYTTKLLDGVDGLVTGVTAIGALVIFLFTMTTKYYQPDIGLAALVLAAAALGFLFFNFHPAKIFLGEGGSLFLGFALGVLAIISGGKIAIALLVMGLPILDVAWTIIRRLRTGRNPFRFADREHLHFRLLDRGLSPRLTATVYYTLAALFGLSALFLQSRGKLLALGILIVIMFLTIVWLGSLPKPTRQDKQ